MQNSSILCDSSAKSTHDHTMALSLPPCSLIAVPGMTAGGRGVGQRGHVASLCCARARCIAAAAADLTQAWQHGGGHIHAARVPRRAASGARSSAQRTL